MIGQMIKPDDSASKLSSLTSLPRQQKLCTQPAVWPLPEEAVIGVSRGWDGDPPLTVALALSLQCK